MVFAPGNQLHKLATPQKPFKDALMAQIKAAGPDHKALRRVAARLLREAEKGNIAAIREVADRIDGKVAEKLRKGE